MARHTTTIETAKPSSSSKRKSGARHAYLASAGVVVVTANTAATLEEWQPPTRTPRTATTYSEDGDPLTAARWALRNNGHASR